MWGYSPNESLEGAQADLYFEDYIASAIGLMQSDVKFRVFPARWMNISGVQKPGINQGKRSLLKMIVRLDFSRLLYRRRWTDHSIYVRTATLRAIGLCEWKTGENCWRGGNGWREAKGSLPCKMHVQFNYTRGAKSETCSIYRPTTSPLSCRSWK